MQFDPTITNGNILTAATMVVTVLGAYYSLKGELAIFRQLLQSHNDRVDRLERRHEERLTMLEQNERKLTTALERIIGQNEERVRWDGLERRETDRRDHDRRDR